ncbi:MAG: transposase [Alphaproteobacteria bacterium]|nr:transposase [Alphaproteobacteria bacterium]
MPAQKKRGRPRRTDLRSVLDAILYITWTDCQWCAPTDWLPPVSTIQRYFYRWRDDGALRRINRPLMMASREAAEREVSPTAGVDNTTPPRTT